MRVCSQPCLLVAINTDMTFWSHRAFWMQFDRPVHLLLEEKLVFFKIFERRKLEIHACYLRIDFKRSD